MIVRDDRDGGRVDQRTDALTGLGGLDGEVEVVAVGHHAVHDGLLDGCLPTLIQWGDTHPTQTMADQGVALESLQLTHPEAGTLRQALDAVGLGGIPVHTGPARLQARLRTPRGPVELFS